MNINNTSIATIFLISAFLFGCANADQNTDNQFVIADSSYFSTNHFGIDFDSSEMRLIKKTLLDYREAYEAYRSIDLPNSVIPAIQFNPLPQGFIIDHNKDKMEWNLPTSFQKPADEYEIAFLSIPELASLIRSGQTTSLELTRLFLKRLKQYDPQLHCVISLTEDYALEYAQKMDSELEEGIDRGILHGIPYGIKDLFAFPNYLTTWGAEAYKEQRLDTKAGVIEKLENSGAVLIAKLSLGALAMGDVWFADTTRNPWNLDQGSSGSSAGSASATAAGLVPFSIGTETYGSIISPSTRCGTTGLRPTYGRVSRYGAMALSWTMDKAGPICRSAHDCAIVFDAIRGLDENDPTLIDASYVYKDLDISTLKVGYYKSAFDKEYISSKQDKETLQVLKRLGVKAEIVELDSELPVDALINILLVEGAAAFDELTRTNRDTLLVQQNEFAWPAIFRAARYMPAVEYIQANRIRTLLIEEYHLLFKEYDVIVVPSFGGMQLAATNLTGHPAVVVPNGSVENGSRTSITFLGNLFDEATILAFAKAYQDASEFENEHPPLFYK